MAIAGVLAIVLPGQDRGATGGAGRKRPKIERLWFHYSKGIARLDPDAQATAQRYYDANNVQGLREFCREQFDHLK